MNPFARLQEELLSAAAEGALVLTSTRRLARRLRQLFDRSQAAAGLAAWTTPAIHSGDAWLQHIGGQLLQEHRLLPPFAARRLWETIVETDGASTAQGLLQGSATARAAEEAHALLAEFGGDPQAYPLTADHAAFLRWRQTYLQKCRRERWLDHTALIDTAVDGLGAGRLPMPDHVFFAGFDDLPPRFRRLERTLSGRGIECREIPFSAPNLGSMIRATCTDLREEVRSAARWVRCLLEKGEGEIGVVVPDLQNLRALIERVFREEIDPAAQMRPDSEEIRFNLSLGVPLDRQGAVSAALEILGAGLQLTLPQAGYILRTPYLGGAQTEAAERARREVQLRKRGEVTVPLSFLAEKPEPAQKGTKENPRSRSLGAIARFLLTASTDRRRLLPGAWAQEFANLLAAVGWPGERPLDSLDYQVVAAWREKCLQALVVFDPVSGLVARGEALALLRRLSMETLFQPEGPESPVQIVGLLESAGLHFRHLWVIGMHDGLLPAAPRPNPFLPIALQVATGMPHADAERELAYARQIVARLFAAAPTVIFSHSLREGDADLFPSPLIRDLPAMGIDLPPSEAPTLRLRETAPAAEEVIDRLGPPIAPGVTAMGGTAILRDQALCPFRAFVRHRLGAVALKDPDLGMDAGERGSLLHHVLELFWHETKDQAGLLALDAGKLEARLRRNIEEAVELACKDRRRPDAAVLRLERDRILLLVREWLLEVEAARSPFVVIEREEKHVEAFGGLEIATRVDRVDRLANGSFAVIDYKTGRVDAADLVGERLLEPQLPVYGIGRGWEELSAVAFGNLRRGKCGFTGVAREGELLPKVSAVAELNKGAEIGFADWQALLAHWRKQLHALGHAFVAGEAAVDPVNFQKACRYCDLVSLCRIKDMPIQPGEGGAE